MKIILSIIALSLIVVSCKDAKVQEYISSIEKMEKSLDSISNVVSENKVDTIMQINSTVRNTILIVKNNYKGGDTVNYEVAKMIDTYKSIRKKLSPNTRMLNKVENALPEEKIQLENLKHDIENGINEREKYEDYIGKEQQKVKQINTLTKDWLTTQKRCLHLYDSLHPIMIEFTNDLKK